MNALTVTLSDAALARLQRLAAEQGSTPEAVAAALVEPPAAGSFLARWGGVLTSGVSDAGTRHDDYLARTLAEDHRACPTD